MLLDVANKSNFDKIALNQNYKNFVPCLVPNDGCVSDCPFLIALHWSYST